ncbi:MAG: Crp/Fnr family transcriptional regulator [Actinomycetota bacterium]|nr:MAG: Crp/Fnr family transcriptional regulator [Actinomycetota bacterium]
MLLRQTALFSMLDEDTLDEVLQELNVIKLKRGTDLFLENDEANTLYIVADGRIAIVKSFVDRKDSMVALIEPGDLFGEMGLFEDQLRSATARAVENSELIEIPYPPIRRALEARPSLLWSLVSLLTQRLRSTDTALADAMFLDVTGRTAKRILEISGNSDEFVLPLTQEELAGLVGASRERVNKTLASFVKSGLLDISDRRYTILKRDKLEQISS